MDVVPQALQSRLHACPTGQVLDPRALVRKHRLKLSPRHTRQLESPHSGLPHLGDQQGPYDPRFEVLRRFARLHLGHHCAGWLTRFSHAMVKLSSSIRCFSTCREGFRRDSTSLQLRLEGGIALHPLLAGPWDRQTLYGRGHAEVHLEFAHRPFSVG